MLKDKPETEIPADVWGPRPGKPLHFQDSKWNKGEDGEPLYKGKSLDFWVKQQTEAVAAIDEGVGRIVKALEETGQLDNTIIVFTADQGYVWGHHGLKGKIDPYETAIRSPFIVSCPKRFPQGKVCKAPINGPDVIRTFHAWAEAEPRLFMPGRDITPLIMNPDSEPVLKQWSKVPTMMTYVHNRYEPMEMANRLKNKDWDACMYSKDTPWYFMILVENYKYTRYAHPDRIEELYDLDKDPEELDNLAVKEEFKDKLLEMRAACIQSIKDNGGSCLRRLPAAAPDRRTASPGETSGRYDRLLCGREKTCSRFGLPAFDDGPEDSGSDDEDDVGRGRSEGSAALLSMSGQFNARQGKSSSAPIGGVNARRITRRIGR
jgi:hypothetical protein